MLLCLGYRVPIIMWLCCVVPIGNIKHQYKLHDLAVMSLCHLSVNQALVKNLVQGLKPGCAQSCLAFAKQRFF